MTKIKFAKAKQPKALPASRKIDDTDKSNSYREPFPYWMRQRFWDHDLNPIIGR